MMFFWILQDNLLCESAENRCVKANLPRCIRLWGRFFFFLFFYVISPSSPHNAMIISYLFRYNIFLKMEGLYMCSIFLVSFSLHLAIAIQNVFHLFIQVQKESSMTGGGLSWKAWTRITCLQPKGICCDKCHPQMDRKMIPEQTSTGRYN